ncbi:MAG TPA: hypothetical protein DCX06_07345 [Opitutae bacterium]|nr:hypothetical protein [Opitutae bacterium]
MKFSLTTHLALLLLSAILADARITVSAQFQPKEIMLGDEAHYVVAITETSESGKPEIERVTSLPIPQSGGLTLRNGRVSSSQQSTIVNFKASHSITQNLIIEAVAPRVGNFTVPSYAFTYKGNTYTAPAATLRVNERDANAPPPINELIFLKVDAPSELYIGQTTEIELKLYVHEQARYRGYESFERKADGFTITDLPEATDSIERIGNYRYQVLRWPLTITPIQSGLQDLNFEFSVVAEVPDNRNQRDRFGRSSPFGGGIFDNFFSRSERFNLFNEPTQINVLPLPESGKPESFSGAVGDFSIQVSTDAENSRAGEPIMLSLIVTGTGNFDRISGPELPESTDWRNYDPESSVEIDEALPLKGVKRFDYVFIPQRAGKLTLPEVNFSFFDPADEAYVELSAPPIAVQVAPSLRSAFTPQTTQPAANTAPQAQLQINKILSAEEALLTLDYRPEPSTPNGFALLNRPSFYLYNSVALIALIIVAYALNKRRRLATDADYAQQQAAKKELKTAVASANSAQNQNSAEDFYRSAQDAVRLAASVRFGQNLRAAEFATLRSLFEDNGQKTETIQAAHSIFEQADALRFSGQSSNSADLRTARQQLDHILKAL